MQNAGSADLSPALECDLVMKGGVTSGLVYARGLRVLAERYRFRSIAGSSAGAIAAAFAAAAEFSRQRGDPQGFERLQRRCEALPGQLRGLFKASPGLEPLLRALVLLAPGSGRARIGAALFCFWRALLAGAGVGLILMGGLYAVLGAGLAVAAPGLLLAAFLGALAGLGASLAHMLLRVLPRRNFGLCSGMDAGSSTPSLTQWLHESLQDIAFGDAAQAPLTFGDLHGEPHRIDLRMVTSNLALSRPELAPVFSEAVTFDPAAWRRLFPTAVMDHLLNAAPRGDAGVAALPSPDGLPVLVALRMSLACPGLLEGVPAYLGANRAPTYFSDGGLIRNFPFDLFDKLIPERPTFALDLDTLHGGQEAQRVTSLAQSLSLDRPKRGIASLRDFIWAMVVCMREGGTRAAILEPTNPHRIFQVWLPPHEGGMNLDMSEQTAQRLMGYGEQLGRHILAQFDFPAHRAQRVEQALRQTRPFLDEIQSNALKYQP